MNMASIVKRQSKSGLRYKIQLSPGESPSRPRISLGLCTLKEARIAQGHIEALLRNRRTGAAIPVGTAEWLNRLPAGLRSRLTRLGLIRPRNGARWTVSKFVESYIESRKDIKSATKRRMQDAAGKLAAFFRDDALDSVTVQQAKNFRIHLQTVHKLAENTVRRQIGICRQFFNAGIDAGLIEKNPFRGQAVSVQPNPEKFFYITPEIAAAVLEACPDAEWRLIFGLARWGGLRTPSETLRLRWQDVDFENNQFTVRASKTEHHAGSGVRIVPMFPELRPLFQDAFDQADEGAVYCITRYRDTGTNLRTQFGRIVKRAGWTPWQKLFQNLRSTRETELFKRTGGNVKAVCSWIGNSPAVALNHYAQVTEADMKAAAAGELLKAGADSVEPILAPDAKGVHNCVQQAPESPGISSPETIEKTNQIPCFCGSEAVNAADGKNGQWAIQNANKKPQSTANKEVIENTPAGGVQKRAHNSHFSPDLARVVDAWPSLPEAVKQSILNLIERKSNG